MSNLLSLLNIKVISFVIFILMSIFILRQREKINYLDIEIVEMKKEIDLKNEENKTLRSQIEKNDLLIKENDKIKEKIQRESDHAKDLYERYFKMYKDDCSSKPVPSAVVERLRKQRDSKE